MQMKLAAKLAHWTYCEKNSDTLVKIEDRDSRGGDEAN